MDHYTDTGCSTTAVPAMMDGEEVDIDEIFVMPSMRVRTHMAAGRETRNSKPGSSEIITTIHELYMKDGQPIRRVCVSGDAGQGKTTLCRKIVSTWCKVHSNFENVPDTEHKFLKSFDLLFYLPLRNQKTIKVIEMIENEIVREASHDALRQILVKESEKCLIILDGLDEWLPSEDCKHKVPYIDPREKFTVLITSRHWKLEVLRPKMSDIGQYVDLNGIKDDRLIKAVVNLLNNKYAKERNWIYFKYKADTFYRETETYAKVKHLAEIPIILTQMVCMWHDEEQFGFTRVEIYSKMLDYLFHMAVKRHREEFDSQGSTNTQLANVFKDFKYCQMYSEVLYKLSELAYHTLFNEEKENSLVFLQSVTEIYKLTENDVKLCLKVGILSQTKLCKASSHKKRISFLHKTFQEFFAALYIAYVGKVGSFNEMLDTLISLDGIFEMSQVLIFLSGIRPDLIGDMSRHIAQLSDKDERVLQYRKSLREKHEYTINRIQNIIYDCIVEVPEHRMLDTKVELHDVYLKRVCFPIKLEGDKLKKLIPYLKLENAESLCYIEGVPSEYLLKLNDLVKACIHIESQEDIDHVTSTVESCASSLTCLSFNFHLKGRILVNIDIFLTALKKVSNLTCVGLESVNLTHSDIERLGTMLSQSTQLKEIRLKNIRCNTCQRRRCNYNYRIDLSHHKQLIYLDIAQLEGDIVLSNTVPLEYCKIGSVTVKCAVSILNTLKSSSDLDELKVKDCNKDDVHHTPLRLSKVLIDVIPTLKNLGILLLSDLDFKQDILRLSPEMTSLENVGIFYSTMTLQCLQGFIDSLPQIQFDLGFISIDISPKKKRSAALKYITDRHKLSTSVIKENKPLSFVFTNIPSH